jgi:hypothetical protein
MRQLAGIITSSPSFEGRENLVLLGEMVLWEGAGHCVFGAIRRSRFFEQGERID